MDLTNLLQTFLSFLEQFDFLDFLLELDPLSKILEASASCYIDETFYVDMLEDDQMLFVIFHPIIPIVVALLLCSLHLK